MAHTISALKQIRQNEKRRRRNHAVKSAVRTQLKKVLGAIAKKDKTASQQELVKAYRLLDKAAAKGVLHRNNVARHKSRLAVKEAALAKA